MKWLLVVVYLGQYIGLPVEEYDTKTACIIAAGQLAEINQGRHICIHIEAADK